jgi:cell wall-associated NlpC family hydrolase
MSALDSRLNAFRPDLAEERLRGVVAASRFVAGTPAQVCAPLASLRGAPGEDARQVTEALFGERVTLFETANGWAWIRLDTDGYVGYARASNLSREVVVPTHRVAARSTFLFPKADLKSQPVLSVGMNARIAVMGGDGGFLRTHDGRFVFAEHVGPIDAFESDFVAVAERFLHVPYLWGGKSAVGLDCSGLVQMALEACGIACPRDTDMQEKALGSTVGEKDMRRGDLVFWEGHVGIMRDATTLLHANGHHMMVVAEPLREAVARIAAQGKRVTSVKRLA